MLTWHTSPIPEPIGGFPVQVLAIHRTKEYTSDIYLVWRDNVGSVARWPHADKPVTHWAYYNIPDLDND